MVLLTISYALAAVGVVLAIPTAVFCAEVIAGAVSALRNTVALRQDDTAGSRAVLVPAHNESTGLQPTLADIRSQLRSGDRLLVVADNCSDNTAAVAKAAGAEVVERHDASRIGKGFALDFGLRHLAAHPPDVVVMIDADCRIGPGALDELASACAATRRPAQALYLMRAPAKSQINQQVAEFAWRVKNGLRPLGLKSLELPCQLVGAGMAIPWDVIHTSDLASSWIVEDLKLGLDLAMAGHPPLFWPSATVTSYFASSAIGANVQRSRWEQGHIHTIFAALPRLIWRSIIQRDCNLLALGLDLAVPPLSLLAILLMAFFVVSLITALAGLSLVPLAISGLNLFAFILATVVAWWKCGRDLIPPSAIMSIVQYILGKTGLYRRIFLGRTATTWVRTERNKTDENI